MERGGKGKLTTLHYNSALCKVLLGIFTAVHVMRNKFLFAAHYRTGCHLCGDGMRRHNGLKMSFCNFGGKTSKLCKINCNCSAESFKTALRYASIANAFNSLNLYGSCCNQTYTTMNILRSFSYFISESEATWEALVLVSKAADLYAFCPVSCFALRHERVYVYKRSSLLLSWSLYFQRWVLLYVCRWTAGTTMEPNQKIYSISCKPEWLRNESYDSTYIHCECLLLESGINRFPKWTYAGPTICCPWNLCCCRSRKSNGVGDSSTVCSSVRKINTSTQINPPPLPASQSVISLPGHRNWSSPTRTAALQTLWTASPIHRGTFLYGFIDHFLVHK